MIVINEPIILSQSQKKVFHHVIVEKVNGKLEARVAFNVLDQDDNIVKSELLIYAGEDFNTFWSNFNSGKFLYEELVKGSDIEVPAEVEDEFLND